MICVLFSLHVNYLFFSLVAKQLIFFIAPMIFMFGHVPGGVGGGGGTLIFSSYVVSGPASALHPKTYQEFQAPQKNYLKF